MKKLSKLVIAGAVLLGAGALVISADHIEAPAVAGSTADITDVYAFEGADPDNTVFVANVQGLLMPGSQASFDESVLIEINIDNDGDLVEDLIIQAIPRGDSLYFFGPYTPAVTGLNSTIDADNLVGSVAISDASNTITGTTSNGMLIFAGPREDAFFFDFTAFNAVISGGDTNGDGTVDGNDTDDRGPNGGFRTAANAVDTFDGTNVLSIVIEAPNSLLGGTFAHPAGTGTQVFNVWTEAKRQQ